MFRNCNDDEYQNYYDTINFILEKGEENASEHKYLQVANYLKKIHHFTDEINNLVRDNYLIKEYDILDNKIIYVDLYKKV